MLYDILHKFHWNVLKDKFNMKLKRIPHDLKRNANARYGTNLLVVVFDSDTKHSRLILLIVASIGLLD